MVNDQTTPVHTINDDNTKREIHNDIKQRANEVLASPGISFDGKNVKQNLPAHTLDAFRSLYPFDPNNPPHCDDQVFDMDPGTVSPNTGTDLNPAYQTNWYFNDRVDPNVAYNFARDAAIRTSKFDGYLSCFDSVDDNSWSNVGFFTTYGLDLGIKQAAGLIRAFIDDTDATPPTIAGSRHRPQPPTRAAAVSR